ncbi:MAG: hypothetical protein LBS68_01290 [Puniceicoccales bacterium]|jgi:hypothetical protein|nr:hypothetical protein [Puniceicoccales bacterium]
MISDLNARARTSDAGQSPTPTRKDGVTETSEKITSSAPERRELSIHEMANNPMASVLLAGTQAILASSQFETVTDENEMGEIGDNPAVQCMLNNFRVIANATGDHGTIDDGNGGEISLRITSNMKRIAGRCAERLGKMAKGKVNQESDHLPSIINQFFSIVVAGVRGLCNRWIDRKIDRLLGETNKFLSNNGKSSKGDAALVTVFGSLISEGMKKDAREKSQQVSFEKQEQVACCFAALISNLYSSNSREIKEQAEELAYATTMALIDDLFEMSDGASHSGAQSACMASAFLKNIPTDLLGKVMLNCRFGRSYSPITYCITRTNGENPPVDSLLDLLYSLPDEITRACFTNLEFGSNMSLFSFFIILSNKRRDDISLEQTIKPFFERMCGKISQVEKQEIFLSLLPQFAIAKGEFTWGKTFHLEDWQSCAPLSLREISQPVKNWLNVQFKRELDMDLGDRSCPFCWVPSRDGSANFRMGLRFLDGIIVTSRSHYNSHMAKLKRTDSAAYNREVQRTLAHQTTYDPENPLAGLGGLVRRELLE